MEAVRKNKAAEEEKLKAKKETEKKESEKNETKEKGNETAAQEKIEALISDILSKKELANLDAGFIRERTVRFLDGNHPLRDKLMRLPYKQFARSKERDLIIKHIRSSLREVYGAFKEKGHGKKESLLAELAKNPTVENHEKILSLHKSSKERLPYYADIYRKLIEKCGVPGKIVDLACGDNPISMIYLEKQLQVQAHKEAGQGSDGKLPAIIASDVSEKDMAFLDSYFKARKIDGKAVAMDIVKDVDFAAELAASADWLFLWKALDSLEAAKRNISRELMQKLKGKARYIIVSFATQSLGGKKMIKKERRSWFEKLCERNGYSFETFEIPGEIFYILH